MLLIAESVGIFASLGLLMMFVHCLRGSRCLRRRTIANRYRFARRTSMRKTGQLPAVRPSFATHPIIGIVNMAFAPAFLHGGNERVAAFAGARCFADAFEIPVQAAVVRVEYCQF